MRPGLVLPHVNCTRGYLTVELPYPPQNESLGHFVDLECAAYFLYRTASRFSYMFRKNNLKLYDSEDFNINQHTM